MSINFLEKLLDPFLIHFNLNSHQITLSSLKGGQSAANLYQFDINQNRFILRIPPANASLPTKAHQCFLTKQAGELGIGPKVVYTDPQFNSIILNYIPGKEAQSKDFKNNALLHQMAKTLYHLHHSKSTFPLAVSPFKRFNGFFEKINNKNHELKKIKLYIDEIEQTLRFYPISLCPTHLDLHLSNIILKDNNEIFLIDWVNGGMSDPFFDLATFSYFSELNENEIENFLTHYFLRKPNEIEKMRFNIILPVQIMVIAASLCSNMPKNLNYELYIKKSIDLIETEIFKYSLKKLQTIGFNHY